MNIESLHTTPQETNEQPSTAKEKRAMAYAEALEVFKQHDSAELEAEQLLFRERLAQNGKEAAVAGLELKIAAAEEQKDTYAERGDPFTEEAWAVRVQFLTALKDAFCLYCDVEEKSPELAGYMEEEMPWLSKTLEQAEKGVREEIEHADTKKPEDYFVDGDQEVAA